MSPTTGDIPEGFGPILRSSPVLEALGGFMSRGEGPDLEVGLSENGLDGLVTDSIGVASYR